MTQYYKEEIYEKAKKQKKNILILFFIVLVVFLLFSAGMFFWHHAQEYGSDKYILIKTLHYSVSAVFLTWTFFLFSIKYTRTRKFCNVCKNIKTGLREEHEATFFDFNDRVQNNNGVDFKSIAFLEWNKYKKEYYEKKVLVFAELPFPDMVAEKKYKYVTQSNILVEYKEITQE